MVGQRVDYYRRVLPRLHHLVQVADAAGLDCECQRPVNPTGAVRIDQVPANQVGRRKVFVTGNSDQWNPVFRAMLRTGAVDSGAETPGHVLDESGLAGSRRALEQNRNLLVVRRREDIDLIRLRDVERLFLDVVLLHLVLGEAGVRLRHLAMPSLLCALATHSRRTS